jgi:hypothetical protein
MAFDNTPVTRWRTFETVSPGMFLEVDFRGEEELDAIVMEHARDQWNVRVKAEGRGLAGDWTLLSGAPKSYDVPMLEGLKRGGIQELRARGIHYMLMRAGDPGASEFNANYPHWGVTYVGERGGVRLYRLPNPPGR